MIPPTAVAEPLAHGPAAGRRAAPRLALGAVLGGVALWLAFRGIDAAELWTALRAVNYIWVGASLASVVLTTLVVTARWRLLFYPDDRARGWLALLGGILVGQMLNILVPARLGDVARVYLVGTSEGLSKTRVAATVVVEKVVDLVVFTLGGVVVLLVVAVPDWVRKSGGSLLITSLLGLGFIGVLSLWGRPLLTWLERHSPPGPGGWLLRLWRLGHLGLDGLAVLRSWQANVAVWGLSILSWLLAATTNYLLFWAFGFPLSFAAAGFLLVVLQLGTAPPSLPGKLGVFHYLTVLALSFFGVARSTALTYALVLYVVAALSKVVAGGAWLAWLRWLPASRRPSHPDAARAG
jgi:uncharacterized membrane protein YbhN (UPF0104 family)